MGKFIGSKKMKYESVQTFSQLDKTINEIVASSGKLKLTYKDASNFDLQSVKRTIFMIPNLAIFSIWITVTASKNKEKESDLEISVSGNTMLNIFTILFMLMFFVVIIGIVCSDGIRNLFQLPNLSNIIFLVVLIVAIIKINLDLRKKGIAEILKYEWKFK